jgi:hypothetical protein
MLAYVKIVMTVSWLVKMSMSETAGCHIPTNSLVMDINGSISSKKKEVSILVLMSAIFQLRASTVQTQNV